jgi:hypothetical protein
MVLPEFHLMKIVFVSQACHPSETERAVVSVRAVECRRIAIEKDLTAVRAVGRRDYLPAALIERCCRNRSKRTRHGGAGLAMDPGS